MNNRNETTALARRIDPAEYGLPKGAITDAEVVEDAFAHASDRGCNILAPITQIHIPPNHEITFSVVVFPFDDGKWNAKSNGTWYKVDGGKVALHRSALDQLATALGLSSVPNESHTECIALNVWKSKQTFEGRGPDGNNRKRHGSVDVDLSDGSPRAAQAKKGLVNARKFGARLAESMAANRAIRAFCGLKGGYTVDEARQPFVYMTLRWVPDMSDPEVARMVTAKQLGIVSEIYGPAATATLPTAPTVIDAEEIPESRRLSDNEDARNVGDYQGDTRERQYAEARTEQGDQQNQRQRQTQDGTPPPCDTCGSPLAPNVAKYSLDKFGVPLCYPHQQQRGGQ